MKIDEYIRKFALSNAYEHKGAAQVGSIVGKLISSGIISADKIKTIFPRVNEVIKEVNSLSIEKQEAELKAIYPEYFKKEKKEETLKDLPGAQKGKVGTRMPPEPGKYMLVGHAVSFLINYIYAQKYEGTCVLRFEDTNAEKTKQEYVESFIDGVTRYLAIKPTKTVYESDDIPKMYNEVEKLISMKKAYICSCSADKMSKLRREKKACEHRNQSVNENLELWKKMISKKSKANEYVVRLIGNMESNNAVMRDPVLARINYTKHYRQKDKYCVWPTYDFANSCEDEWCNVTHILRSIDFGEERIELQKYISKLLGFRDKYYIQYGRINIAGLEKSSGREIRALVEKGAKWDDPQMPTIAALERRGFVKETFYELAKKVGLSRTPTKVDETIISSINRKFIDSKANRYFFVDNPVKIKVDKAPNKEIKIKLHPENDSGFRKFNVGSEFYIKKEEAKGKYIRLKDYFKIEKVKNNYKIAEDQSLDHEVPKIQWVPVKENINVEILMTDGSTKKGFGEKSLIKLKEKDTVQFERFGFCRLDKKLKNKLIFVFGHN